MTNVAGICFDVLQMSHLQDKINTLEEHKEEYLGQCYNLNDQKSSQESKLEMVTKMLKSLGKDMEKVPVYELVSLQLVFHKF